MSSSNETIAELIRNQIPNVDETKRLQLQDMKRIARYLRSSPFMNGVCSPWTGYITNYFKKNKGTYVNFYFRKKKVALHRLLYYNYVGPLAYDEYVKFLCPNKGFCCNIHCFEKRKYRKKNSPGNGSYAINEGEPPLADEELSEKLNVLFI